MECLKGIAEIGVWLLSNPLLFFDNINKCFGGLLIVVLVNIIGIYCGFFALFAVKGLMGIAKARQPQKRKLRILGWSVPLGLANTAL